MLGEHSTVVDIVDSIEPTVQATAKKVRNRLLNDEEQSLDAKYQRLATISGMIAYNNVQLYFGLRQKCSLVNQHVAIEAGVLVFSEPQIFNYELAATCRERIERAKAETNSKKLLYSKSQGFVKRLDDRLGSLTRVEKLWQSNNRRALISAIITPDGYASSPQTIAAALSSYWAPQSTAPEVSLDRIHLLLQDMPSLPMDQVIPPRVVDMRRSLMNMTDTAPGTSGARYSAYKSEYILLFCGVNILQGCGW